MTIADALQAYARALQHKHVAKFLKFSVVNAANTNCGDDLHRKGRALEIPHAPTLFKIAAAPASRKPLPGSLLQRGVVPFLWPLPTLFLTSTMTSEIPNE